MTQTLVKQRNLTFDQDLESVGVFRMGGFFQVANDNMVVLRLFHYSHPNRKNCVCLERFHTSISPNATISYGPYANRKGLFLKNSHNLEEFCSFGGRCIAKISKSFLI